jgi:hypothetical protein
MTPDECWYREEGCLVLLDVLCNSVNNIRFDFSFLVAEVSGAENVELMDSWGTSSRLPNKDTR